MEIALIEFYFKGDVEKLKDILCVTNVNAVSVKKELLEDTKKLNIENNIKRILIRRG